MYLRVIPNQQTNKKKKNKKIKPDWPKAKIIYTSN